MKSRLNPRKPLFSSLPVAVHLLLAAWLLQACSYSAPPTETEFIVNGNRLESVPAVTFSNGQMLAPASFLEQQFHKKIELAHPQTASGNAHSASNGTAGENVYYSGKVAVLMYHDMSADPGEDASKWPTAKFEAQLTLLQDNGFSVIDIETYLAFMLEGAAVPDNAVLLTFDDGYESFFTEAYPVLKKFGYPAVNFVIVSAIDRQTGRPKMTWEQMREMKRSGMSFYSHTYNMHEYGIVNADGGKKPLLTGRLYDAETKSKENDEIYRARITKDLALAEKRLKEELGNERSVLAFPYGAYNEEVLAIVQELGIDVTFTVKAGLNGPGDAAGFRYNGSKSGESAEQFILKLKSAGRSIKEGEAVMVTVDSVPASFEGVNPVAGKDGEIMVPLRDFCKMYGIRIEWDHRTKTVRLDT
ncbi:polysaccharide deacetylase family protein [Paenibacillus sp. NPDC058071]|uniref:polysaccharide deacetylase family protein n=1 Tax=Paenibacillus sp. NPDC058071 TaxID=3346326 RepID=UPI0036DE52BF